MCVCVCVCVQMLQYLEEDEEGVQFLLAAASVKVLPQLSRTTHTSLTRKYESYGSIAVGEPSKTEHSTWNTRATSCTPTVDMEFTKTCMEYFLRNTSFKTIGWNEGIVPFLLLSIEVKKFHSFFPFPLCIFIDSVRGD